MAYEDEKEKRKEEVSRRASRRSDAYQDKRRNPSNERMRQSRKQKRQSKDARQVRSSKREINRIEAADSASGGKKPRRQTKQIKHLRDQLQNSTKFQAFLTWLKRWHVLKWLIFLVLLAIFVFESYLVIYAKTVPVEDLENRLQQTTQVYDKDQQLAGQVASEHGTYVKADQISDTIKEAVISTEDKRFYGHHGFDLIGISRAALNLVLHGYQGGGSTLTQQLVKNSFLNNEHSMLRKFKELMIALEIEKYYDKDKILEMYLNHTYFGYGVYGVEDACMKYFGKHAADAGWYEASLIAGMLKGPSLYNPIDGGEMAQARRETVLHYLVQNGYIDENTEKEILATPISAQNNPVGGDNYQYPYYFDAVIEEAIAKYGLTEDEIMKGGYQIYTNLNQNYQNTLQTIYNDPSQFPISPSGEAAQSATVVIDPYNGGVLALVGGNSGHTFRGFNRATQMKRQPGSTIKPLLSYTAALENGMQFDAVVPDEVKAYGKEQYKPENHDHVSVGELPLYQALAQSKNTTAVWLMNKFGIDETMSKLKAFGMPYSDEDLNLSSALGGLKNGVSPLQLASAYTTFVNEGQRSKPQLITKIVDASGKVIVDNVKSEHQAVMNAKIAREMTSMLLDVYNPGGTGGNIEPAGYQLAGKTGTVELATGLGNGTNDEWFVAYTPDMVVTSWYGFDETDSEHYLWSGSPVYSGNNFYTIMANLLPQSEQTPFSIKAASTLVQQGQSDTDSPISDKQEPNLADQIIDQGKQFFWDKMKHGFDQLLNQLF